MKRKDEITALKEMITSCWTYGGAGRDNWNFKRYIEPYREKVGKDFDKIYEEHLQDLINNYEVEHSVYTDAEGCTYNQLIKK